MLHTVRTRGHRARHLFTTLYKFTFHLEIPRTNIHYSNYFRNLSCEHALGFALTIIFTSFIDLLLLLLLLLYSPSSVTL